MPTLAHYALANAAAAALLAVPAWAVGRWGRRPALAHGLWLLVLLKLITPPLFLLPLPWLPPEEPEPVLAAATTQLPPRDPVFLWVQGAFVAPADGVDTPPPPFTSKLVPLEDGSTVEVLVPGLVVIDPDGGDVFAQAPAEAPAVEVLATSPVTPAVLAVVAERVLPVLGLVWAGGALVWFGVAGSQVLRFQRLLKHARPAPADLQELAEGLAARLGMARCPRVRLLPGPLPPLVWAACGRARLYFPAGLVERLDPVERATLVAHELAHVRRRDHWVRWVEIAASGVFWWYPLVWYVRGQVQATEEECCDAWVVSELPPRAYASALLATLDFLAEDRRPLPALASGLGKVPALKRRLALIMAAATPRRMSAPARLAWLALALLLLPLVPTLARSARPFIEPLELEWEEAAEPPLSSPWSVLPWAEPLEPTPEFSAYPVMASGAREASFRLLAWSPDGRSLAAVTQDHRIEIREGRDGGLLSALSGHTDRVNALAFSPDGKVLAIGSSDCTVRLWDVATGAEKAVLEGHTSWVHALAFSPDGTTLASGGYDRTVRLWDVATGQARAALGGHQAAVRALAFGPDGQTLASGGGDRKVILWDAAGGTQRQSLSGLRGTVRGLAFGPGGRTLAGACEEGTVCVWDVRTGEARETFRSDREDVAAVAFSPRGRHVALGAADGTIGLYDVFAARRVASLGGRPDAVRTLAFAADGRTLAVAGPGRGMWLWKADAPRLSVSLFAARMAVMGDLVPGEKPVVGVIRIKDNDPARRER